MKTKISKIKEGMYQLSNEEQKILEMRDKDQNVQPLTPKLLREIRNEVRQELGVSKRSNA
jgi:hypothetical protein